MPEPHKAETYDVAVIVFPEQAGPAKITRPELRPSKLSSAAGAPRAVNSGHSAMSGRKIAALPCASRKYFTRHLVFTQGPPTNVPDSPSSAPKNSSREPNGSDEDSGTAHTRPAKRTAEGAPSVTINSLAPMFKAYSKRDSISDAMMNLAKPCGKTQNGGCRLHVSRLHCLRCNRILRTSAKNRRA